MHRVTHLVAALVATAACVGQLAAQTTGTIAGRIIDASTQQPISRVTVTVDGYTAQTDADGRYVVTDVAPGTYTLRANVVGYRQGSAAVTVVYGQTTNLDFALDPMVFALEALVVTGYGQAERKDLTGVVSEVPAEAFNTGRIVSTEELIRGKAAGVQVTENNGGQPGGGLSIRIRGGTSITSSNEPLYVIDGVPVAVGGGLSHGVGTTPDVNAMGFLNPEDIESIAILKDASSTAIYGSRGANGVVMITTKSGRGAAGTGARFTYRGNMGGSKAVGRPSILNASEFRQAVTDYAPAQLVYLGDQTTDWVNQVERSAMSQEHTLVFAAGAQDMAFRASVGYLGQEGVIQASKNERVSLSLNYQQQLFDDQLDLRANLTGSRVDTEFTPGGVVGSANNFAPTQPVMDAASPYGGYFEWDDPLATNNPIGELNLVSDKGTTYRSIGNLTGEYFLPWVDGLSATARLGYLVTNSERRYFAPSINKAQEENGSNGTVSRQNPTEFSWLFDGFLTYDRVFGNHGFNVTAGYSFQGWRTDRPSFQAQQLSSDLLGPDGIPSAQLQTNSLWIDENRLASWFGRVNYNYNDRYLITATVRADGSSRFGEGNRWGTFPSAAVAWRLSEESFLDSWESLSDLKLRVSWGKNGNQAFGNYRQYKDYVYGGPLAQVQFGNEFIGTIRPSAADPNIKWESTASWNFGLDYGFWNNRLWGSIEYYTKKTTDLILDVIVAAGTNLSNVVTTNVGSIKNKGVEFTLNTVVFQGVGDGFTWDANFNVTWQKNEILQLNPYAGEDQVDQILAGPFISGGVGSTVQVHQPGYARNSFLLYQHIRDANGKPIYEDVNSDGTINEQDLYVDTNGDGIVNFDDRVAMDSPMPDWIFGHTSLMRWKSFDFSFTLLAELGNYMYNNVASSTGFYDQLVDAARPSNLHRSVLETSFVTPQYFSDYYLEDASFLRMENIQLGYTFRRAMNGIRIYGGVQNVFTLTGYSGVDPTSTTTGIDNNIYPRIRTFTAGLNVGF